MKTILFVCGHNAGRSQMAEAFTNLLARECGLSVRACSAGTGVADRINPMVQAVMAEAGVSMEGQYPKPLTGEMVVRADRIITMGCGVNAAACPAGFIATEDWGLDDPAGQPLDRVRLIRDQVQEKVIALLDAISASTDEEARQ